MTALDFPANPVDGQAYNNYVYDESKGAWRILPEIPSISARYLVQDTAPTNPIDGQIWLNSTDGVPYIWYIDEDSGQWIEVGGINGAADPFIVSDTPPEGVVNGTQWFDTVTGNTFIYYTDVDSAQWIQSSGNSAYVNLNNIADVSAASPSVNETIFYDGSNWINDDVSIDKVTNLQSALDAKANESALTSGTSGFTALSAGTAGISYQPLSHNYIINGAFDVWQRGTSVTPSGGFGYGPDRWRTFSYASSSSAMSRQSFSPADLSAVSFGDAEFFARISSSSTQTYFETLIENVRTLAGQQVTISFYAKAASAVTLSTRLEQNFGSGGSEGASSGGKTHAVTTSWQRFTHTVTVPTISGKTVGANSFLSFLLFTSALNTNIDLWGVQLEAGSVATPFKRHAPSLQGELAACQRYYYRTPTNTNPFYGFAAGHADSTNVGYFPFMLPVEMRATPTFATGGNFRIRQAGAAFTVTSISLNNPRQSGGRMHAATSGLTAGSGVGLDASNDATSFLEFISEL